MGKLIYLISTFKNLNSKKLFHFIASSCPEYVTGPFLARVMRREGGRKGRRKRRLSAKQIVQLIEAGARSKEDLIMKIVDVLEHQVSPPSLPPSFLPSLPPSPPPIQPPFS